MVWVVDSDNLSTGRDVGNVERRWEKNVERRFKKNVELAFRRLKVTTYGPSCI